MPSHLTRGVFRRLLANEPIIHRGCLRRQSISTAATHRPSAVQSRRAHDGVSISAQQVRTFMGINLFGGGRKEVREADMVPGLERMMELEKMRRLRARLPDPEDVNEALHAFFRSKNRNKQGLEDTEAKLVRISLQYLLETDNATSMTKYDTKMVNLMVRVMDWMPVEVTKDHIDLAKFVLDHLEPADGRNYAKALRLYCNLLCGAGDFAPVRELLLRHDALLPTSHGHQKLSLAEEEAEAEGDGGMDGVRQLFGDRGMVRSLWQKVLESTVGYGSATEVQDTMQQMAQRGFGEHVDVTRELLRFAIKQDDAAQIRALWKQYGSLRGRRKLPALQDEKGMSSVVHQVLSWCLRTRSLDLGQDVVTDVMKTNPSKSIWDSVFVWAAGTGKGVDEIGRMIGVMESANRDITDRSLWRQADTATINRLVEFAISKQDPYMAERFISLGRERGIEPDASTYVLQIDYRLSVSDVDGALAAYMSLQTLYPDGENDLPAVNRLIVALCGTNRHDFETIMNVAADLSDRHARFEPATVAALSKLHLSRGEKYDVMDLLNTHAFHYSSAERTTVRDAMIAFCTNPHSPTPRAWEAYNILREVFDELSREPRTAFMSDFFQRSRPDMAVQVFQHMRSHSREDTAPTADTYVSAFLGAAKMRNLDALEVLHNQLKLDYNIDMTTYLRNALIASYTACGQARKSLAFWDEICASREGPSYNSIHIALRACEKAPFGDLRAQQIWEKLRRMKIDLDNSMWASYVAALAGNGDVQKALTTVETAVQEDALEVDAFLIGSLFNSTPGAVKQGEVEAWTREKYPGLWTELEGFGVDENDAGNRLFHIDRSVSP